MIIKSKLWITTKSCTKGNDINGKKDAQICKVKPKKNKKKKTK